MRTLSIILVIIFLFCVAVLLVNGAIVDVINHTVCTKDKTIITCHYDEINL